MIAQQQPERIRRRIEVPDCRAVADVVSINRLSVVHVSKLLVVSAECDWLLERLCGTGSNTHSQRELEGRAEHQARSVRRPALSLRSLGNVVQRMSKRVSRPTSLLRLRRALRELSARFRSIIASSPRAFAIVRRVTNLVGSISVSSVAPAQSAKRYCAILRLASAREEQDRLARSSMPRVSRAGNLVLLLESRFVLSSHARCFDVVRFHFKQFGSVPAKVRVS